MNRLSESIVLLAIAAGVFFNGTGVPLVVAFGDKSGTNAVLWGGGKSEGQRCHWPGNLSRI